MHYSVGDYGTFYRHGNICQYIVTAEKQVSLGKDRAGKLDSIPDGYTPIKRTINRLNNSSGTLITSNANEIVIFNNTNSTATISATIGDNIIYITEDSLT